MAILNLKLNTYLCVFSRQMHGFTCGIGDLMLIPKAEKQRRHKLQKTETIGNGISAKFVGLEENGGTTCDLVSSF